MLSLADVLLLLALAVTLLYFYLIRSLNYWKNRNVPYEKPTVLFGNLLDIVINKDPVGKYFAKLYAKFEGPYFGIFAFNRPYLMLKDPDLIKRVLIKDFQVFQNRAFISDEKIDPFMCSSLFGLKSPHWRPLRTKLSPIFTSGKMKLMFHLMNECGNNLGSYTETILGKGIEAKEITGKYTTDVISTCAFGITANSFVNENSEFRMAGRKIFERHFVDNMKALAYFFAPTLVKIFKFRFIPIEPATFLSGAFMETITQRELTKNKRNDLIDILVELKNQETKDDEFKFHDNRLIAQAIVFFTAGHETTSATMSFTFHELCIHTDMQDRVRNEILEVIEKHGDLTYEAVQDMKYLDMLVSETLRKYPLTPFVFRECSEDYKIPETGLVLEKGTPVLIPQHGLHWDPKYFPNPEQYDPERFSEENKHKLTPYVYLPFGDGPRVCIGERFALLTTKLGLIHILKNFRVVRNSETQDPLMFTPSALLQAKNGIRLTFEKL